MKKLIKYMVLFLVFGVTYYFIETLYSGSSSTTSIIMGGIGGILISFINIFYSHDTAKWKQITLTALAMIFIEMVTGLILKQFGIIIWDYTGMFMNVEGVICLQYSLYWLVLSPIAIQLDDLIEWTYFGGQKPDGLIDYFRKLIKLQ
jgi:uncharacterized membrane protein